MSRGIYGGRGAAEGAERAGAGCALRGVRSAVCGRRRARGAAPAPADMGCSLCSLQKREEHCRLLYEVRQVRKRASSRQRRSPGGRRGAGQRVARVWLPAVLRSVSPPAVALGACVRSRTRWGLRPAGLRRGLAGAGVRGRRPRRLPRSSPHRPPPPLPPWAGGLRVLTNSTFQSRLNGTFTV